MYKIPELLPASAHNVLHNIILVEAHEENLASRIYIYVCM